MINIKEDYHPVMSAYKIYENQTVVTLLLTEAENESYFAGEKSRRSKEKYTNYRNSTNIN